MKSIVEWHPCTEPPENHRIVLVAFGVDHVIAGTYSEGVWWRENLVASITNVKLWADIPNPAKKKLLLSYQDATDAAAVYGEYPRKVGRPVALQKIAKAIKKYGVLKVMTTTRQFAAAWKDESDKTYCPHPATWFGQERFNDDPSTWGPHRAPERQPLRGENI
jgi:hypothetical protein